MALTKIGAKYYSTPGVIRLGVTYFANEGQALAGTVRVCEPY